MKNGILITFEGTEGAGKSTLILTLSNLLRKEVQVPRNVIHTREPGGSPLAEQIRKVILSEHMDPLCELFLYEAARAEHLAKTIRPALSQGAIVLCDRFTDSSLAYQAYGRGLDWKKVKLINRIATEGLAPHLTVWIDIDPARGLARALDRNRFEEEGIRFQKRVRQGFLKARRQNPKRWLVLKASKQGREVPPSALANQVLSEIKSRFPRSLRCSK